MKKTINLKQITPMWHFQPDLKGCCLRATEVKPKLDKFLAEKDTENKLSKFRIGETNAYDYKLSFLPIGEYPNKLVLNPSDFRLYFANMGEGTKKELVFYKTPIQMSIFTLHKELESTILENLCDFFATHSFGTRQDKGFGYFFLEENEENMPYINGHKYNGDHGASYVLTINLTKAIKEERDANLNRRNATNTGYHGPIDADTERFKIIFEHINYFHKIIRSGINEGKAYHKSFMYFYARSVGKQWDKVIIRRHFQEYNEIYKAICMQPPYDWGMDGQEVRVSHQVEVTQRDDMQDEFTSIKSVYNPQEFCLFRDALGLASEQLWLKYNKDIIRIESENKEFARFKSPISYRPSQPYQIKKNGDTYVDINIHLDETGLNELKKQKFTITHSVDNPRQPKDPIRDAKIFDSFSLSSYFDFIMNNLHILNNYNLHRKPDRYLNRLFDLEGTDENVGLFNYE